MPQVGRFAAHVGAGDERDEIVAIVEIQIVGNEAAGFLIGEAFDHRMASGHNAHFAVIGKRRAAIPILGRHLRQRSRKIEFGHRAGRGADALRLRGYALPHCDEQLFFQCQDLIFGVEHLALVVLQLGRGEALGIGQRLLAFVIGRRQMLIGARDLDVVAEDVVESHLERLNARTLPLARFNLRDILLAVLAEIA